MMDRHDAHTMTLAPEKCACSVQSWRLAWTTEETLSDKTRDREEKRKRKGEKRSPRQQGTFPCIQKEPFWNPRGDIPIIVWTTYSNRSGTMGVGCCSCKGPEHSSQHPRKTENHPYFLLQGIQHPLLACGGICMHVPLHRHTRRETYQFLNFLFAEKTSQHSSN